MSDYKKYVLSYFLNISKNRELSEELAGLAAFKHVSCRESILEAGHRTNYICLVVSGLVRGFYIDEEAKDRYMLIMKEQPELIKSKRQLTFSLQLKLQLFASCLYQFVGR